MFTFTLRISREKYWSLAKFWIDFLARRELQPAKKLLVGRKVGALIWWLWKWVCGTPLETHTKPPNRPDPSRFTHAKYSICNWAILLNAKQFNVPQVIQFGSLFLVSFQTTSSSLPAQKSSGSNLQWWGHRKGRQALSKMPEWGQAKVRTVLLNEFERFERFEWSLRSFKRASRDAIEFDDELRFVCKSFKAKSNLIYPVKALSLIAHK